MLNIDQTEPAWYCFTALPKKEHQAALILQREAAIETFCPRIAYDKSTKRGKVRFVECLFPGYLFAFTDLRTDYRRIRATLGIRDVVAFGGQIPPVPNAFIDDLRSRMHEENLHAVPAPVLKVGQTVTVTEGPFRNWQAVISGELDGQQRIRLLLDFLGRQIEIKMHYDKVILPDAAPKRKVWEG